MHTRPLSLVVFISVCLSLAACGSKQTASVVSGTSAVDSSSSSSAASVMQSSSSAAAKADSFRDLTVGQDVPAFTATSVNSTALGPTTPSGKFFLYVINDAMPAACLDDECGPEALAVTAKGGHVMAFSDPKVAAAFGIQSLPDRPLAFDGSVLVVADAAGKITGFYEKASIGDVPTIAAALAL